MFKWVQVKKHSSKCKPPQKATLKKQINQIQLLSGVTQADFQSLYVKTIERFSDYLTDLSQACNEPRINPILDNVILALKKRQGYLLPLGADSEVVFREREEWTFAVFTAALFSSMDTHIRFALAKAILPHQAFVWLNRNSMLFSCWENYLQDNSGSTIFNVIILQKQPKLVKPASSTNEKNVQADQKQSQALPIKHGDISFVNEISSITQDQKTTKQKSDNTTKPQSIEHQLPDGAVIKEIDLQALSTENLTKPPLQRFPKIKNLL